MKVILFPGQGSQHKGMGKELFPKYPEEVKRCSEILGYDIHELCLENQGGRLRQTQFSQPAIFFVSALSYLEYQKRQAKPEWMLGHSLGEITALFAAEAFDLETGIRLVKQRGELMAQVSGGAMAAILGLSKDEVEQFLQIRGFRSIDIANDNAPEQVVASGPENEIHKLVACCDREKIKAIPLNVSGAFHSRYMQRAAGEFTTFLKEIPFKNLRCKVIANATAKPYSDQKIQELLTRQIAEPVRWVDSIVFTLQQGATDFVELESEILTKMAYQIRQKYELETDSKPEKSNSVETLGCPKFRESLKVSYNYVTGSMYRGISSSKFVIKMANAGFLSFFGAGGLSIMEVEKAIDEIQDKVGQAPFGVNFLCNYQNPESEFAFIDRLIAKGVKIVEAAAFIRITPALAKFAIKGLYRDQKNQEVKSRHHVFGKVSSIGVAERFIRPIPEELIQNLLSSGHIDLEEARLAQGMPVSHFLTFEADSGGHTDQKSLTSLIGPALRLKEQYSNKDSPIYIGIAGGVGTPEIIATAFIMGVDYVVTGSINHCSLESGTSDRVKELLQSMGAEDTAYAPAGDMFEMGSKVQVLKKGVLFPNRANKLFQIYSLVKSLDDIPDYLMETLEQMYFRMPLKEVFEDCIDYFTQIGDIQQVEKAYRDPKHQMSLIFRWYLGNSNNWAIKGDPDRVIDYQIHIGPSLGAFNSYVRGTPFASWKKRHVDEMAILLMDEATSQFKMIKRRLMQ